MKNFTFISTLIALSFVSVFGQNATENSSVCTNQTVEKISSRGVRLGISQQETLNLFAENGKLTFASGEYLQNEGRTKITPKEVEYQIVLSSLQSRANQNFGFSITSLIPKDALKFDGIARYDLGFLDNRLAIFNVYYLKPKWENREQFIRKMSELLNLPVRENYFNVSPYGLKCGDYTVDFRESYNDEARYSLSVSVNIDEITQQRRKKDDDEQREKDIKVFKP